MKAIVLYGGADPRAKPHVLMVRGSTTRPVGGTSMDLSVRRVAVLVDGRVVVQTTNGQFFLAGQRDLEPLGLRAQAQAQVVADAVRPVVWIGTEAGAVLRLDPTARTLDTVWPSGDPPVTALAAEDGRILVGRGEGSLEVGGADGPRRVIARFPGSVRAVALSGDLVAALGPGHLAVLRLGPDGPTLVHLSLVAPTRNLAFLRAGEGLPLVARCQVTREDDMGTIATPRLLVTSLDPDVAGAEMAFDPWPVPGGGPASPWTLRDVHALRPADDGRSVDLVVAAEGALRVVDVDVRPLPSGGGR
ncbi:MAG TPA: hypothetical protein VND21_05970 [Planctomycetota bacterium]|nr:hypothetical protein [Planctomycetota bacterium]